MVQCWRRQACGARAACCRCVCNVADKVGGEEAAMPRVMLGLMAVVLIGCAAPPREMTWRVIPSTAAITSPAPPDPARYTYVGELVGERNFANPAAPASRGARIVSGKWMLVYQAAAQLELWTGRKAPVEIMASAFDGCG